MPIKCVIKLMSLTSMISSSLSRGPESRLIRNASSAACMTARERDIVVRLLVARPAAGSQCALKLSMHSSPVIPVSITSQTFILNREALQYSIFIH